MEKIKNSNNFFIRVLLRLLRKNVEHHLNDRAAIITYYLLLSIGPFLVLIFGLLIYILSGNVAAILKYVNSIYEDANIFLDPVIEYLSSTKSTSFVIIGLLAALFSASKSAKHLIKSMGDIFKIKKKAGIKKILSSYFYAMFFTLALVLSIIIFFIFFVTGDPITLLVNYLFNLDLNKFLLWTFLKNYIPIIYLIVFVTILFKVFSTIEDKNKTISLFEAFVGAAFVSGGWILGSLLFTFYIKNFNSSNAIYGALGSIMVLMLWFYILIYMLLLGAALIVSYTEEKNSRQKKIEKQEGSL